MAGHARNRCFGTDIDELAARGLDTGANLDVAVREAGLDEAQVAQLVPDRRVVLDARGAGVPRRDQQRGRGQEPRAQRQQPSPARGGVARRSRGSGRRRRGGRGGGGGRGAAGRDGERSAAGPREQRRRDLAGRHERRQGGDGWCHGCWLVAWIWIIPELWLQGAQAPVVIATPPEIRRAEAAWRGGLWMFEPATAHCSAGPGDLPGQAASFGVAEHAGSRPIGDGGYDACSPEPNVYRRRAGMGMHSRADVAARQVGRHATPHALPCAHAARRGFANVVRRRAASRHASRTVRTAGATPGRHRQQ